MQIANIIAGFTLSEADEMGVQLVKRLSSLMDKMAKFVKIVKNVFIKGKSKTNF